MLYFLTGNDLMVQMTALTSGAYLQLPTVVLNLGESASAGTGMMISTLLAVDRLLNWLLAYNKKRTYFNRVCCIFNKK